MVVANMVLARTRYGLNESARADTSFIADLSSKVKCLEDVSFLWLLLDEKHRRLSCKRFSG